MFFSSFTESKTSPQNHAVCWDNQVYSYSDVHQKVHRIKETLSDFSLLNDKNALVLLCLPRGILEYLLTLSLLDMGMVGLNTGQDQSKDQIQNLLKIFPIKNIITHRKFLPKYFSDLALEDIKFINEELVLLQNSCLSANALPLPKECAWTLLTSGSTGGPKIVMISQQELYERAKGEIRDLKINSKDRLLNFLSFSHDLGLNQLLSSFMTGSCLFIHKYVFLSDLLKQITDDKITGLTSIANIWREFLKKDLPFDLKNSHLRYFTISGESLNKEELELLIHKSGEKITIYRTYGQTETFRSLINDSVTDLSTGLPLSNVRLEIDYTDDNETGELIHYGAGTMLGYLNDPELNKTKFTSDGGIKTGDFFKKSDSGHFQFIGRRDDMKKINGIRFYPVQIENAILKHPSMNQCCVFLFEEKDGNSVLVAAIESNAPVSDEDLTNFLRPHLSKIFVPQYFFRMDAFPKIHSGKIDRKKVGQLAYNFLFKI